MNEAKTDSEQIVERFTDTFPWVSRADEDFMYEDDVDGRSWISDATVLLATPEISRCGLVDFEEYTPAEYVETRSLETNQCYVFTAGGDEHLVDVEYVRTLANDVFEVSYDTMKDHAHTINDSEDLGRVPDGSAPVMFDVPDAEFRVVIAPYCPKE